MIIVVARLKAREEKAEEVERELRGLVEYVRNEERGTLTFVCLRGLEDPTQFTFYERYRDKRALSVHQSSVRLRSMLKRIKPMLDGELVAETYEEIAGKRSMASLG